MLKDIFIRGLLTVEAYLCYGFIYQSVFGHLKVIFIDRFASYVFIRRPEVSGLRLSDFRRRKERRI